MIIFGFLRNLFYSISFISITVLAVLNTTVVYRYVIDKYGLSSETGLSKEVLMDNYERVINYVQNPFNKELSLNSLTMSEFGRIHFYEVKQIFIALYIFAIIFIIIISAKILIRRNKESVKKLIENFSNSVNIMILIFVSISAGALIDFSKTFIIFHKIFFRNNYWIFNPKIDPIINALPEELFAIEFALIVVALVVLSIIIKVVNFKLKNTVKSM